MYGRCPLCERSSVFLRERGFCADCDTGFQREMNHLIERFNTYLANHAAFAEWLALNGKE